MSVPNEGILAALPFVHDLVQAWREERLWPPLRDESGSSSEWVLFVVLVACIVTWLLVLHVLAGCCR